MSKTQILSWINEFLGLSYSKIEQTCSGVVALQVMDALFPGMVPLSKVNFNAKYDYEYAKNLKVLQGVFVKAGIEKVIDIDKLSKGKYQDNLEFMQWLKTFFEANWKDDAEYDAVGRRQCLAPEPKVLPKCPISDVTNENTAPTNGVAAAKAQRPPSARSQSTIAPPTTAAAHVAPANVTRLQTKIDGQARQIAELKEERGALEKQRDFYYGKLRNIEILLDDDTILNADIAELRSTLQSILFNPAGDFVCMDSQSAAMEQ